MASKKIDVQFEAYATKWLARPEVQLMDSFVQHGTTSTLDHTKGVAHASLAFARALHLNVCEADLVAGALLHDFYLYDWHDRATSKPKHATQHPVYAAENARELLGVNAHVASIIETHMWPLPPSRVPKSTEAWIVTLADKYCSLKETIGDRLPGHKVRERREAVERLGVAGRHEAGEHPGTAGHHGAGERHE